MKKINLKALALLLAGALLTSSCIGSFGLFNKYEKWQCSMTSNNYVNGIVGLILQPIVAPICLTVDALVLNTIEFWTGSKPIAMNQEVMGTDGKLYAVKSTKHGYKITSPTGEVTEFRYDAANNAWSVKKGNLTVDLFRFNADGTIAVNLQNGQTLTVGNDEAGLQLVKEAIAEPAWYYAQR